jgi:ubiquinone/menaquinone biosynthesis C-methylase UbiE
MRKCLTEMHRVLKRGGYCVLVLGDVARNGKEKNTARILRNLSVDVTNGGFEEEELYSDVVPDNRRSRRRTRTTKIERILVMRKS